MKGICPSCEKVTKLEHIENEEEIKVRGECIKVNVKYFKCLECGEQFDDPSSDDDPLDKAYREYRIKHAMIQPEEIKELRKQYGLTQKEFSKLLGFGGATISRYENGALQDEVHDKLLQLMKNQENMYKLLLKNEGFFSPGKKDHLLKGIKSAINDSFSFANVLEEKYANYKPCIDSGYNNFDSNKLFNMSQFQNAPFWPISALGSNFNPQNT